MPVNLRKLAPDEAQRVFPRRGHQDLSAYVAALRDLRPGDAAGIDREGVSDIRCPLCGFPPWPGLTWQCGGDGCGYAWDTFATRGVCPRCHCQWTQTQCPACHRWSPHEEWYG